MSYARLSPLAHLELAAGFAIAATSIVILTARHLRHAERSANARYRVIRDDLDSAMASLDEAVVGLRRTTAQVQRLGRCGLEPPRRDGQPSAVLTQRVSDN